MHERATFTSEKQARFMLVASCSMNSLGGSSQAGWIGSWVSKPNTLAVSDDEQQAKFEAWPAKGRIISCFAIPPRALTLLYQNKPSHS